MVYILDNKTNLASEVIPVGNTGIITVYSQFAVNPMHDNTTYLGIYNTGDISIGAPNTVNNVVVSSGVNFSFIQITDITLTDYTLTPNDYAVEIIADSINTVTLPTASNTGGRTYIISRGSNNNNLVLRAQVNENIDTRPLLQLTRKNDHIKVMSNGQDSWYIV